MDAHDKLGIICIVFTSLVIVPIIALLGRAHGDWLMAAVFFLICTPLFWIGGLQTAEFVTKPFVEKGLKGIFSWIVTLILVGIIYAVLGVGLLFLLRSLQLM